MAITDIDIVNSSSYDLHISFKCRDCYSDQYLPIDIKKGTTVSFNLGKHNRWPNPNKEVTMITISNIDGNEIITELDSNDLFDRIRAGNGGGCREDENAYYMLEITDELLYQDLNGI